MTGSSVALEARMTQAARVFVFRSTNRHNEDPIEITLCESHGAARAASLGMRMHEETHIRLLFKEQRKPWGRLRVTARPLREGETIRCEECEPEEPYE